MVCKQINGQTIAPPPVLYLQASLEGGDGEQGEVLLLFSVAHEVNVDQLLHLRAERETKENAIISVAKPGKKQHADERHGEVKKIAHFQP